MTKWRNRPKTTTLPMRLAVEMRHLRGVVAGAGGKLRRYRRIDAREIVGGELEGERVERLLELLAPARARHRQNVVAARTHPGQRELRRACAFLLADLTQRLDQAHILLDIALLETRHARKPQIALGARRRQAAAQQSA